jgi:hypothetical protein
VASILVVVAVIGGSALIGRGPLAPGSRDRQPVHLAHRSASTPPVISASPRHGSTATSTTIASLAGRSYRPGDCVTWNQQEPTDVYIPTTVVPCTQPHLLEVVRKATPGTLPDTFPSQAAWGQLLDADCGPPSTTYLGYPLFPNGRFYATGLHPDPTGWSRGDRTLWCGIGARSSQFDPSGMKLVAFTGAVRGQSQELPIAVGTCLSAGTSSAIGPPVPCSESHVAEVTGTATLSGVAQLPTSSSDMASALAAQCAPLATQYGGGALPSGSNWGWLGMSQASWNAGERTVSCTIGDFDTSGNPVARTGSLQD